MAFDDGSVGWYEAGWGPMMSETAFFVKDVIGPKGSVSIVMAETARRRQARTTSTPTPRPTRSSGTTPTHGDGSRRRDERIDTDRRADHDDLCEREQRFLLRAIDEDLDLDATIWTTRVRSLRIVLAADEAVRTGRVVSL